MYVQIYTIDWFLDIKKKKRIRLNFGLEHCSDDVVENIQVFHPMSCYCRFNYMTCKQRRFHRIKLWCNNAWVTVFFYKVLYLNSWVNISYCTLQSTYSYIVALDNCLIRKSHNVRTHIEEQQVRYELRY